jgi:hypothetical protein
MSDLTITDLGPGQCRFPVTPFDAPKHFFCGEPVEYEKCPYCAVHAARCFDRRTAEKKRDDAMRLQLAREARTAEGRLKGAQLAFAGPQSTNRIKF